MKKSDAKIVIAEDDPLLMQLYREAFTKEGYPVESFFSGEDAYAALQKMEKKPSVIISDVTMPRMNGLEMLEKIRATPELKDIPVMLITNLPPEQYAAKGLGLGAVAYLAKGKYTMRELVDKVNTFLNVTA